MRLIKTRNMQPLSLICYFLAVTGISVFSSNVVFHIISIVFSIIIAAVFKIFSDPIKDTVFYFALFVIISVMNPFFSNKGITSLFYLNGRPVTVEALLFGMDAAVTLIGSLIWFRIFSAVFTSDKIAAVAANPHFAKIPYIFILTLRYVPMFKKRFRQIMSSQKSAGMLISAAPERSLRNYLNVFFTLAASSLELCADASASLKARGFDFVNYRSKEKIALSGREIITVIMSTAAAALIIYGSLSGLIDCGFYPELYFSCPTVFAIAYALLCTVILI